MRLTHAEWGELELIDEIERSRRDALAALMREHEAPLYRLLVVLTGDRDVALDCVQDTFTRAYEHLRKGRTVTTPWLYKVGRNRAIDEFRRRKREQVDRDALYDIGIESTAEDMVSLRQAFAALSSDDRAILSLAGIEGLSGASVAARIPFYRHLLATAGMKEARTPQRMAGLAVLFMLGLVILSTVAYAANSIIHVYRPEEPPSQRVLSRLFLAPLLPPYQTVHYRLLDPQRAAEQSGYALAYLHTPPADLDASVGVDILPHVGWQENEPLPQPVRPDVAGLAMAIRSLVRYRRGGHTAIVLLNEPSPRVIETRELELGTRTVHLPDGREAWTSTDVSQSLPFVRPKSGPVQVISWVVDHYVVSIFSDLPPARLRLLAADVQVVAPKANPQQRRIPATWPTPLPLERLPARLQAVTSGSATYQRQGPMLTIRYFVDLGSYSQGALYGLNKWKDISIDIVFPPDLQRRSLDSAPHQQFPGGSGGVGGDVRFSAAGLKADAVTRLVRRGMDVRLTWTEKGERRRQTFHFPIVPAATCTFQQPTCAPTKRGH